MVLHQRPLRTICDALSLSNSALLSVDSLLWCTKILFSIVDFRFLFHRKNCNPNSYCARCVPPNSLRPIKPILYLDNSPAATVSEPALHWLLTFHVPNPMSIFRSLGKTKVTVLVRGKCSCFVTKSVLWWVVVNTSLNPEGWEPPLVGCPRLHIRSYPPYWRPLLHPQPEDVPCRGDRDPLIPALIPV